jgi:hypothetical protein
MQQPGNASSNSLWMGSRFERALLCHIFLKAINMISSTTSSTTPDNMVPWEAALLRLLEKRSVVVTKEEATQIAAQIDDPVDGPYIVDMARRVAQELCASDRKAAPESGILLLKELAKAGDGYSVLVHAWVRWNDGPLKNHQHALALVEEAYKQPWVDYPGSPHRAALGEIFRLHGLLLLKGEKVKRDPIDALNRFKFAADKYLDGEAASYAAQMHSRNATAEFKDKAKPHAKAVEWYTSRAAERAVKPPMSEGAQGGQP